MLQFFMIFLGVWFIGAGFLAVFGGGVFESAVPASVLAIAGAILLAAVYIKN